MSDKELQTINTILDSVADAIFTVDEDMKITTYNKAAESITGIPAEEAIGRPCHEVFRADVCFTACPVKEAIETGMPVTDREVHVTGKNGRHVPVSISANVLRDANGRPVGGVETMRDQSLIHVLQQEIENKFTFGDLLSRNKIMNKLFAIIPDIAASEATVLIKGDSGTGKELFAKAIHENSPRKDGPLVIINCGALPEPLLEAEIFGARRGAYTGSIENRPGRLEMAKGGTLFLDELGDLPLPLQVKLLRVLENHEYQPLGAPSPEKADVRFIAATHRNLEQMVDRGEFRRDLFFRINVVSLTIPSLKERPEDIPLLVDKFLKRFNSIYHKNIKGFSPEAMQLMLEHDYPGNVRELLNLVEQTVILCKQREITVECFPESFLVTTNAVRRRKRTGASSPHLSKEVIIDALEKFHGNKGKVSKALGIDRTTLWRWMKRLDIQ
ncbi:MAG: Fis family transcriptional regulator [Desulfuromonas sp.]|nr:MAG: Fis family transcriptional regulator [Desulfuromonas sp.]